MPKNTRQRVHASDLCTLEEQSLEEIPFTQQTEKSLASVHQMHDEELNFPSKIDFMNESDMVDLQKYITMQRKNKLSKDGSFDYRMIVVHPPSNQVKNQFWSVSSDALKVSSNIYGKRVEFLDSQTNNVALNLANSLYSQRQQHAIEYQKVERRIKLEKQLRTYNKQTLDNHLSEHQKITAQQSVGRIVIDPIHTKSIMTNQLSSPSLQLILSIDQHLNLQLNTTHNMPFRETGTVNVEGYNLENEGETLALQSLSAYKKQEMGYKEDIEDGRWISMDQQQVLEELPEVDFQQLKKETMLEKHSISNSPSRQGQLFSQQFSQQPSRFEERFEEIHRDYAGLSMEELIGTGTNIQFFDLVNLKKNKKTKKVRFVEEGEENSRSRRTKRPKVQIEVDFFDSQELSIEDIKIKRKRPKRQQQVDSSDLLQPDIHYRLDRQIYDKLIHSYLLPHSIFQKPVPSSSSPHIHFHQQTDDKLPHNQLDTYQQQQDQQQQPINYVFQSQQRRFPGEEEGPQLEVLSSQNKMSSQPVINIHELKECIYRQLKTNQKTCLSSIKTQDGASSQLKFISLLHLANQNGFHLRSAADSSDVDIVF